MKSILTFLLFVNCAFADSGRFRFVKGQVFIGDKPASKGQSFKNNDVLSTKKDSLGIVTLNDGSTIKLDENSAIIVNQLSNDIAPTNVTLSVGSVVVNALKSALRASQKDKFILRAKSVSMGVRGTTFFASFGKEGSKDVWMCVNEGVVAIGSSAEKSAKLVNAGEGVRVLDGEKTSNPKPLPWTKKLNWNLDSDKSDELVNKVKIEEAYTNPLEFYYE